MQCPKCSHESICGKKTNYASLHTKLTETAAEQQEFTVKVAVACKHFGRKNKKGDANA